jgi:hypothetical protein
MKAAFVYTLYIFVSLPGVFVPMYRDQSGVVSDVRFVDQIIN